MPGYSPTKPGDPKIITVSRAKRKNQVKANKRKKVKVENLKDPVGDLNFSDEKEEI